MTPAEPIGSGGGPEQPAGLAGPVCFRLSRALNQAGPTPGIRLRSRHADALSELLPILICGEESAALFFDRQAHASLDHASHAALAGIADDEDQHERLLAALRRALPPCSDDDRSSAELRRFFKTTADRNLGIHFARIAALDSAVCGILGTVRRSGCPVGGDPVAGAVFAHIHRDEARHVKIAMGFVTAMTGHRARLQAATEIRFRFSLLLAKRADALERLDVDPDRLLARIRAVPGFFRH